MQSKKNARHSSVGNAESARCLVKNDDAMTLRLRLDFGLILHSAPESSENRSQKRPL